MSWRLAVGAALLVLLGGCRCLEPVDEFSDGGDSGAPDSGAVDSGPPADAGSDGGPADAGPPDAGQDAGAPDAGPVQTCTSASQCTGGAAPGSPGCPFAMDAGNSCIDGRCLYECRNGRTCGWDAGPSCLACIAPAQSGCLVSGCGAAVLQGTVEALSSTCNVPFTDVMLVPTGGCQYHVVSGGVTVGTVTQVSTGDYVGQFDGLGTCVGMSLFTQIERWLFSCAGCQFVLRI